MGVTGPSSPYPRFARLRLRRRSRVFVLTGAPIDCSDIGAGKIDAESDLDAAERVMREVG